VAAVLIPALATANIPLSKLTMPTMLMLADANLATMILLRLVAVATIEEVANRTLAAQYAAVPTTVIDATTDLILIRVRTAVPERVVAAVAILVNIPLLRTAVATTLSMLVADRKAPTNLLATPTRLTETALNLVTIIDLTATAVVVMLALAVAINPASTSIAAVMLVAAAENLIITI
jgi:hypothetical protein